MDLLPLLSALGVPPVVLAVAPLALVGLSSVLAAAFPQPTAGSPWARVRAVVDALALNMGHAKNATVADRLAVSIVAGAKAPGPFVTSFEVDGSKPGGAAR